MRNSIKGIILMSFVALAACKNDKTAASSDNTVTSTPSSASTATASVGSAASEANIAATSTKRGIAGPLTPEAAKAAMNPVTPDANKVTPSATTGKTTTVKFDEMSYDWGKLKEGEKMTHLFKFKNTGENDLIISDARGSCGCTVPEWPKEPIKSGKSGEIKVIFDSAHKSGPQSKTVTINANTEPNSIVLMIKGTVETTEEPAKQEAKTNK
jgi:Protein of unknown function (DUF1573)